MLDLDLSALYPSYLRHLTAYKRALEQRNALLRQDAGWTPPEQFEPWEEQLSQHGVPLREARQVYIARLSELAKGMHAEMGRGEALRLEYIPKDEASDSEALLASLRASRVQDALRSGTSVGPHRDDFSVFVAERDGRLFGSQGQQRTAVVALKVASLLLATQELGRPPLLLLDDILSDLDETRRALLVEVVLANAGQAVLTCTEPSAAGKRILSNASVFHVKAGEVTPA
jgi:DNA replication and repair protein RecF